MEFITTALDTAFTLTIAFTAIWLPLQFAAYVARSRATESLKPAPQAQVTPVAAQNESEALQTFKALEAAQVTKAIALADEILEATDTDATESEAALLDELIAATEAPAPLASAALASAALAMTAPVVAVEPIEAPSIDYSALTVAELRASAKDRGIRTRTANRRFNKSELLSALA
jgi:hypothetical protein